MLATLLESVSIPLFSAPPLSPFGFVSESEFVSALLSFCFSIPVGQKLPSPWRVSTACDVRVNEGSQGQPAPTPISKEGSGVSFENKAWL